MGVLSDLVTADRNIIGNRKELTIIVSHLSAKVYPAVIRGIEKGIIKTEGLDCLRNRHSTHQSPS